jgi:hypothetical protein
MAFIRWKKNSAGNLQAYLIQSYRDEAGKPKHKMLAYLGDAASLTPEHVAALNAKYPDIKIDWEKVKPVQRPRTDISKLNDAELLKKIRHLRYEMGLNQNQMVWALEKSGMPKCTSESWKGAWVSGRRWGVIEKALENGEPQDFYENPEIDIAPALRKAFLSQSSSDH